MVSGEWGSCKSLKLYMMSIRKILAMSILIYSAVGCGDSAAPKEESADIKKEAATTEQPAPAPAPDANAEKAVVSFKVNGVQAKTTKGGGNDSESQLGMITATNNPVSYTHLDVYKRQLNGTTTFQRKRPETAGIKNGAGWK